MSFRLYTGEYLVSPVPLHFGLNWCTHACFYCFANLAQPNRRVDPRSMAKIAKGGSGVEKWFLDRHYPILMANDSDPLAISNIELFYEVRALCQRTGYRLTYQTKGGKREDEDAMLDDAPTMIYVSLTSDDETLLAKTEPGAPGFRRRMDLICRAKQAGHHVVVGVNPCVSAWWKNWPAVVDELNELDVRHIWAGSLHFSRHHLHAISPKVKEQFAQTIAYGLKRNKPDRDEMAMMLGSALDRGINVFGNGVSELGHFWDAYFALGFPFFPTLDGWFDILREFGQRKPVVLGLDDLRAYCRIGDVPESSKFKEYCNKAGRSLRNMGEEPKARTYDEVLGYYWRVTELPSILRQDELCIAADLDNGQLVVYEDDAGQPLMTYVPGGSAEAFHYCANTATVRYRKE